MSSLLSSIFGKKQPTYVAPITPAKSAGPSSSHSTVARTAQTSIPKPAYTATKLAAPTAQKAPSVVTVTPAAKTPSREIVEALVNYKIIDAEADKVEEAFNLNDGIASMRLDKTSERVIVNKAGLLLILAIMLDLKVQKAYGDALDKHIGFSGDPQLFDQLSSGMIGTLYLNGCTLV